MIAFASTFLTTLGLPSALLTMLGKHFSAALTISLIIFAFLLSFVANWRSLKNSYLPASVIIAEDTFLHCPCDANLADEAKLLARKCYAADKNSITPEGFELLRVKNSLILACLTTDCGEFLGYFDVIPLKNSFAQSLLEGIVTEKQVTPHHVLAPDEMASCEYLFISGLAVWDAETYAGSRNASMLVWGLLKYLERYYGSSKPIVFAIASTDQGDELMQRFKLPIACEATRRIDKYRVYAIHLSPDEIAKRLACLPDWSNLCTLEWLTDKGETKTPSQKHRRPSAPRRKAYSLPSTAPRVAT